jgi:hypothetical protein
MQFPRVFLAACLLAAGAVLATAAPAWAATRTVCAMGCDFTTIAAAVAGSAAGDTISIGAGTYPEHSILVNKPLIIVGAGTGVTIVDGQNLTNYALAGVFNVRAPAAGAGVISISGLTVVNAGKTSALPTAVGFAMSVSSPQAATAITSITFDDIEIVGTGARDYGIYATGGRISNANHALRQVPTLTVSNSTISGTNFNGIGADAWNADFLVEDNALTESTSSTSAILIMNEYTEFRMTAPNTIRGNTSVGRLVSLRNDVGPTFGGYDSLTVTGNTITGLTGTDFGIQVATNAVSNAAFSRIGTATITGNAITGDGIALGTRGVLVRGLVENAIVHENDISGVGTGISVILDQGQGAVSVLANRNRLFADNVGLGNATTAVVDANDNWWGCVAGPTSGNGYCAPAENTGAGTLDTTRWISAMASAASPVLAAGASTTVTGEFGELNTGVAIVLPAFFVGLDVEFTVDSGSVVPAVAVLDPALSASTTYTAPAVGPDEVRVAVDRADFPGAPAIGPNLHYGSLVVRGEPIPIAITVTALGPGAGGPTLANSGGTVSVPWATAGFGAIAIGTLLVLWSANRPRGRHLLSR